MARWQRPARLIFGVCAVAVVVALYMVIRERVPQLPAGLAESLDPKESVVVRGGDVVQHKGSTQDVRVKFSKQITYEDGRTKFEDFEATADNRGGRTLVVSGKEAWVGSELSSYDLKGSITLRTSDGLVAESETAAYASAEGILRAPGPVKFQRERMSGSGVGFTYDQQTDALWLLDQAIIRVAPEGDQAGMDVASGTAGHSRKQRYLRFERGFRMVRQGQVVEATDSTVFLLKESDEPDTIELRGGSKITGATGTGSLQAMQARDINLDYATDGRTLEKALLAGQSSLQLAQKDGSAGQQLTAEYVDLSLAPDGAVTRLVSRDQVRVSLPAVGDTAARTVTATTLNADGEAGRGLTAMTFEGGIEYREDGASGKPGRVARAQSLKAALAEDGTIERAEFTGGFTFEEGRLNAASSDAIYDVVKGTLALTSEKDAVPPHLQDERVAIDGTTISVTLSPRYMKAKGNVRTVLGAGRRQEGERGSTLLKETEAVLVFAEQLEFDEESGKGSYSGKARLQQGQTSIHADAITLDERQGDLRAEGSVMTVLPIAGKKTGDSESSIAKAGEFHFDDTKRSVVYAKQAQMDGVQGSVHADRIELLLAAADNALDRLEANGAVKVAIEKREASGKRLVYHPTEEKYVLDGTPVKLLEGCRETTGRTLTFYRASDRILIDGNEEQRTQSKGGTTCPEPPKK